MSCIMLVLSFGCKEEQLFVEEDIEISHDTCFEINGQYQLCLDSVQDSRCPLSVDCVRGGEAITWLRIQDDTGAESFNLCLSVDGECKASQTVLGFEFKLTSVLPYPETTDPIELDDYIIGLTVRSLSDP